jgi:hypothetical protein
VATEEAGESAFSSICLCFLSEIESGFSASRRMENVRSCPREMEIGTEASLSGRILTQCA